MTSRQTTNMSEEFTPSQMSQLQKLMAPVNLQLANGEKRMDSFAHGIADLGKTMQINNQRTDQMWEAFDTASKGLKVLGWMGQIITKGWPIWASLMAYFGWKGWIK